jgi:N-acetyl-anhydromuramyl-L-alanine amidase AmpD
LPSWLAHRNRANQPTLVVLHATAGATAQSSIDHLRGVGLSYHYIIPRDGRDSARPNASDGTEPFVFHCVPNSKHAFHVGSTVPPPEGSGGINKNSIGISLANIQRKANPEDYPRKQREVLDALLQLLRQQVPSLRFLTTHAVVQPWNRGDPLRIDGQAVAERSGLQWWKPTRQQILDHTPP